MGKKSKARRGRPKSAESVGKPDTDKDDDAGEILACECGKTFSFRRNLNQHRDRCPLLTARNVSPLPSDKRRKTPSPMKTPRTSGSKLLKLDSYADQTPPETVYVEDASTVSIISLCKLPLMVTKPALILNQNIVPPPKVEVVQQSKICNDERLDPKHKL